MVHLKQKVSFSKWEIPFQVLLHVVVFLIYAIDANRKHGQPPQIEQFEIVFFLNYAVAAFIINYMLFPHFLYQNRWWPFFVALIILVTAVILIEELVLEQIYFPDNKGKYFGKIIFNLADVLPIIVILSGLKLGWDISRKQMLVEELKATVEESELKFLKSQLNPHFLFNNLNNLYSHALENSPKTPEIILEMSSVLRYMLYECRKDYVPLITEIEQLHNFIRLYEMQIEGRGKVHYNSTGVENTGLEIAPLIMMVFVENAFKHSADEKSDQIDIRIDIRLDGNELLFECENSTDYSEQEKHNQKGIGLENVKKRLEYLYPDSHQLEINSDSNAYRVVLKINLSASK